MTGGRAGRWTGRLLVVGAVMATSAMAYEGGAVSDGGTIAGRVTYAGSIPVKRVVPTSDREVCGSIREWALVERDADNGLKNAVVYLDKVERGKPWPEEAKLKNPVLDNHNCMFEPHVQVIRPGEIDIHNSDDVLHNTKGYYGRRAAFNIALPHKDMSITRELARPGVVRFECDAHGWMEAWAYALEHPYFAITADDGSFSIADVPPGEYTLITRQEYIGSVEQPVKVGVGETVELSLELKR